VVAWSHEAGRCARNARKLGKAVGVRKRVLCARALELLRLHAYEEQSARRHQGIEDGIVLMSQRRQQRMCEQGVRVWLGCVRREAEERRLQMERDKRREKMEAVGLRERERDRYPRRRLRSQIHAQTWRLVLLQPLQPLAESVARMMERRRIALKIWKV
jgi:hypothetical protein